MSKELKYLVIHCTATPAGVPVSSDTLRQWHMGPLDLSPTGVRYMGKTYASRAQLPDERIGGAPVSKLKGRGWSVPGYSVLIQLNGLIEVLHHFNDDRIVDPWEITNGVQGINSVSRHVCYVGGMNKANTHPLDTRTRPQSMALAAVVKRLVQEWPGIKVAGHNQFASKACPSFDVAQWCERIGLDRRNILTK